MPLRLVFMGTPDFAVPTLSEILRRGHEVAAVYTRAPKPAGRGMELHAEPGRARGAAPRASVLTPATLHTAEAETAMRAHAADAAVVVAYGLILPKPILDALPLGGFNLHASLLPRWRGAAPINRAIMAGDAETGVMVMKMDEGLDTGPVAMAERVPIAPDATAGDLHDALARLGADLMVRALAALERGTHCSRRSRKRASPMRPRSTRTRPASIGRKPWQQVHDHIRGLSPFPGAWCEIAVDGKPVRVKVLRTTKGEGSGPPGTLLDDRLTVACGEGAVRILELQRAGRQAMKADEFLRGTPARARHAARLRRGHAPLQAPDRI